MQKSLPVCLVNRPAPKPVKIVCIGNSLIAVTGTAENVRNAFRSGPTIARAVEKLIDSKRISNRRDVYIKSLGSYLARFYSGREEWKLSEFGTEHIESWLSNFESQYSRQTWLNRISTLFSFALRRGWIDRNPCDKVERVTVDKKAPKILTVKESRLLLSKCHGICRPWLVLALFAGVRPNGELMKMRWDDVNLETATARINFPKVRKHRRIVPLQPIAVTLLKDYKKDSGPLAPSHSTVRRFTRSMRTVLGWPSWPQDVLRHTAASYLLALIGDAGKVAMMLGNSPQILLTHYHEPVTKEQCEEFWNQHVT